MKGGRVQELKLRSEAKTCNAQTIGLNQNPRNGGTKNPAKTNGHSLGSVFSLP